MGNNILREFLSMHMSQKTNKNYNKPGSYDSEFFKRFIQVFSKNNFLRQVFHVTREKDYSIHIGA